ncbi:MULTISPECIES: hypothetical protein [Brevibacillus]|jgi:hypothetical protein|uniref:Uncharacterized protein n=1 Tax=Brevibacillus thermoruber TaxID=33942 RepID=A0A9X3Z1T3_9BACL|nr:MULTISPECIES: hypothetical protein [Brevibacillus]MDA5106894.1 hypothetical protein [Brevibacillus thermoruber]TRY28114.1 hypothetical protein FOI68_01785 [Brevibacillus sp. LEMMJ03]UYZ11792.1 hypothetical protein A6764_13140 [Brevibacillus sp. WF146]
MANDFNERYRRFSRRVEKGIIALIAISFIMLTFGELLIELEPVRAFFVETHRLEGVPGQP